MSDAEGKKPDSFTFHYNRDKRLERAPENVKNAYERGYTPNRGFIKGLTANVGTRSIFFSIIIMSALIIGLTIFDSPAGSASVEGVPVRLKALYFDESVFITLTLAESSDTDNADLSAVFVIFHALDPNGNIVVSREAHGVYSGKELTVRSRISDFEVKTVKALVKLGNSTVELGATVDRD